LKGGYAHVIPLLSATLFSAADGGLQHGAIKCRRAVAITRATFYGEMNEEHSQAYELRL